MTNKILISIAVLVISTTSLFSHGTEKHEDKKVTTSKKTEGIKNDSIEYKLEKEVSKEKVVKLKKKYKEINEDYIKDIKPIFQAKCFNCHSNTVNYPFYYKIPGIQNMIDKDIKEAKEHIDFSNNFPFISHETPLNDLKSLKKIAQEGGMPPLKYILGHWDSKLTKTDSKALLQWTKKAINTLREEEKETK